MRSIARALVPLALLTLSGCAVGPSAGVLRHSDFVVANFQAAWKDGLTVTVLGAPDPALADAAFDGIAARAQGTPVKVMRSETVPVRGYRVVATFALPGATSPWRLCRPDAQELGQSGSSGRLVMVFCSADNALSQAEFAKPFDSPDQARAMIGGIMWDMIPIHDPILPGDDIIRN